MKKKWLLIFATCFLVLSSVSFAYATTVTSQTDPADNIEEIGDEITYILNADTQKTDNTPCQVTAKFNIPAGFHLNAYMDIMHDDGTTYRILTTDDNGYSDFAFVKEGHYIVLTSGIIDDTASKYSFSMDQNSFMVDEEENSVVTVTSTINDYDEIAQTIAERNGQQKQEIDTVEEANALPESETVVSYYPTNIEGVMIGNDGNLYYDTVSNSKTCTAQVYGNATGTYDLYFEVIKPGVLGEAEFKISLDGGKTFIGTDISAYDYSFASHGLSIDFSTENDTDELEIGDTFTASVPETFAVSSSGNSNTKDSYVIVSGHPEKDYYVKITMLSTGKLGIAKYSLSLDNGTTTEYIDSLPETGEVTYGELTYYFSNTAEYTKDTTYTCQVESNIHEISYVPLYALLVVAAIIAIIVYVWLILQKEKAADYRINAWTDRQDESKYQ